MQLDVGLRPLSPRGLWLFVRPGATHRVPPSSPRPGVTHRAPRLRLGATHRTATSSPRPGVTHRAPRLRLGVTHRTALPPPARCHTPYSLAALARCHTPYSLADQPRSHSRFSRDGPVSSFSLHVHAAPRSALWVVGSGSVVTLGAPTRACSSALCVMDSLASWGWKLND